MLLGALVAFVIFGRRAQRTVYRKAEGQTGAAAWALDNLRGKWRVTPGVAATGNLDAVHRVIGRPGVIFVGEDQRPASNHCWLRKKRTARLVEDVPIYDIIVGNGDGEFRWPSWSATSPAFRPTSRSSRWTRWSRDWRRWVRVPVRASCPRTATHHGQDAQRPAHGPP